MFNIDAQSDAGGGSVDIEELRIVEKLVYCANLSFYDDSDDEQVPPQ